MPCHRDLVKITYSDSNERFKVHWDEDDWDGFGWVKVRKSKTFSRARYKDLANAESSMWYYIKKLRLADPNHPEYHIEVVLIK